MNLILMLLVILIPAYAGMNRLAGARFTLSRTRMRMRMTMRMIRKNLKKKVCPQHFLPSK
jgi:hypothetical protein